MKYNINLLKKYHSYHHFLYNVKHNDNISIRRKKQIIEELKTNSLTDLLLHGFPWRETFEGAFFWQQIYTSLTSEDVT